LFYLSIRVNSIISNGSTKVIQIIGWAKQN
jgi:hypothetical protein